MEAKIIALTKKSPPKPFTHWSVRRMASAMEASPATVQRIWKKAGAEAAPHRVLQGQPRPGVRIEGRGDHRPVHESAGARCGFLCGYPVQRRAFVQRRPLHDEAEQQLAEQRERHGAVHAEEQRASSGG
jgi:hypothetical protein